MIIETLDRSIAKSAHRVQALEDELRVFKAIDLERIINDLETQIINEKQHQQYLLGLRARLYRG